MALLVEFRGCSLLEGFARGRGCLGNSFWHFFYCRVCVDEDDGGILLLIADARGERGLFIHTQTRGHMWEGGACFVMVFMYVRHLLLLRDWKDGPSASHLG